MYLNVSSAKWWPSCPGGGGVKLINTVLSFCWFITYHIMNFSALWRHQMETFCALLALCAGISPVTSEFPSQASDTEFWCLLWSTLQKNDWVNNRDAGGLRRHRVHYDITVMGLLHVNAGLNIPCNLLGIRFCLLSKTRLKYINFDNFGQDV